MTSHRLHRLLGLWSSLLLILAAVATLLLNHRAWILPLNGQGDGPFGQYVLSHSICASDPQLVLVGTSGGLFSSEDGGHSYREVTLPVSASPGVVGVAFHPNEPTHLYAVLRTQGIYSSLDGGNLWTRIAFDGKPIQSFGVGFDGSLSVLTPSGLYRRVGDQWQAPVAPPAGPGQSQGASRSLVRLAYDLHDGQLWGRASVIVTDILALLVLLLVGTGLTLSRKSGRLPDGEGSGIRSFASFPKDPKEAPWPRNKPE